MALGTTKVETGVSKNLRERLTKEMQNFIKSVPNDCDVVMNVGGVSMILEKVLIADDDFFSFKGRDLVNSAIPVQVIAKCNEYFLAMSAQPRPADQESTPSHSVEFYIL